MRSETDEAVRGKPETFNFLGSRIVVGRLGRMVTVLRQTMRQSGRPAAGVERRTAAAHAHAHPGTRSVSALGPAGHFRIRSAQNGQRCAPSACSGPLWQTVLSRRSQGHHLPWPVCDAYRTVASDGFDLSSLSMVRLGVMTKWSRIVVPLVRSVEGA